jgi:NAD(P)-dependent dehydrogenase (short-subunit alcohol dehydrogenase family)
MTFLMSQHKTVFLTGGARGIGAAILEELKASRYRIIAPSREELDLSSAESVDAYLASLTDANVDILINNAGVNHPCSIPEISSEKLMLTMQVNLASALTLTQFFAPGMAGRGYGRILNTSSIFGAVTKEGRAVYSVSKAALDALTRSSAVEFGPRGVLVNSLAPGYVDTELTRQNNTPAAIEAIVSSIPLRRMAKPEELAKVAAFLVSEGNTYITGQTIVADGGFTCL